MSQEELTGGGATVLIPEELREWVAAAIGEAASETLWRAGRISDPKKREKAEDRARKMIALAKQIWDAI